MSRRGGLLLAFIVVIVLIVVCGSLFYVIRQKSVAAALVVNDSVNVTPKVGFPLRFSSSALEAQEYRVYNSTEGLVAQGMMVPGVTEAFSPALENATYEVRLKSQHYYLLSVKCVQERELSLCRLSPSLIAQASCDLNGQDYLTCDAGLARVNRAVVCVAWGHNTVDVSIPELPRATVPNRLWKVADKCYFMDTFTQKVRYKVNVTKRSADPDTVEFRLIDLEAGWNLVYTYEASLGMPDYVLDVQR